MAPAAANESSDAVRQDLMTGPDDGKYRKLLHLFRFSKPARLNKSKSRKKSETVRGSNMKNGGSTPEERRSQLERDMRRSWDSLPETLRRRRQRVSRDLLCQFVDPNEKDGRIEELSRTAFFFDDEDDEEEPPDPDPVPMEIRTKVMLHHDKEDDKEHDHAVVLIISDSPNAQAEGKHRDDMLASEELEAVELLARAVSSDSLQLNSSAGEGQPAETSHTLNQDDSGTEPKSSQPDWPYYEVIGDNMVVRDADEITEVITQVITPLGSDNAENPYTVMEFENATIVADSDSTDGVDSLETFDVEEMTELPSGRPPLTEELPVLWVSTLRRRSSVDCPVSRRPVAMETIAEEPSSQDDSTRLTVREILQKFETLGGRVPAEMMDAPNETSSEAPSEAPSEASSEPPSEPPENAEDEDEKGSTLKDIQETLQSLEEKVRKYNAPATQTTQSKGGDNRLESYQAQNRNGVVDGWTGRVSNTVHPPASASAATSHPPSSTFHPPSGATRPTPASVSVSAPGSAPGAHVQPSMSQPQSLVDQDGAVNSESWTQVNDGKHSLLQFAMHHFRQSPEKFEMLKTADGSISGSLELIESLKTKKNKGKGKNNKENEWTWKEQVELVKFSTRPIEQSLLRLETEEMNELAVECFVCIMRYMGDLPMTTDITEVKCVYTVLMHCHKHEALRDEVYCQLMKQTTNNKSTQPESCQRGWRLFSIVAAYFVCSDTLKPYLFKYLETAAYDKRRAYHGTAMVCLQNLRKTFRYGGRKNVPSVEEITAISAGRNSKRQMYRLPGGTERVVNTRSTTVVQDVIDEICGLINVVSSPEVDEFSLYCIVEGDTFTMPLAREEYILDVTTELQKNQQVFYLIFCRSVWHFPLRLDSQLYIEVVFNQIAPDYLEGLLLVMPGETLQQDTIYEIAKIAALLHRAADMTHVPAMKETKFLLPKPALTVRDIKPTQWVNMVQSNWVDVQSLDTIQAKAQVLDMLSNWPLFGSSFFAVKRVSDPKERADHILALNRHGVHFIDVVTHETLLHHPFSEVISTRKVKSEDGTLFLDMKCGNLMQQRITRLQTDQAHEISRLIRQYITLQQRMRS